MTPARSHSVMDVTKIPLLTIWWLLIGLLMMSSIGYIHSIPVSYWDPLMTSSDDVTRHDTRDNSRDKTLAPIDYNSSTSVRYKPTVAVTLPPFPVSPLLDPSASSSSHRHSPQIDRHTSNDKTHPHPEDSSWKHQRTEELLSKLDHYEYVVPRLVDDRGVFISYDVTSSRPGRRKRSMLRHAAPPKRESHVFYHISAYGRDFNLNLTVNKQFLSPMYTVEYWDSDGPEVRRHTTSDCHFVGHVNSDDKARVAVSNCIGLHGMFATAQDEYFIEPLWNDTRDIHQDGRYHVVYKRSSLKDKYSWRHCGVTDKTSKQHPNRWHRKPARSFNQILKSKSGGFNNRPSKDSLLTDGAPWDREHWRRRRRDKRSTSVEKHVETLVVIDKQMVAYHGDALESYVLTVMNIVAKLYHDASLGNAVNIVITRLIILRDSVSGLEISHHADRTLESFCAWQQHINPPEDSTDVSHQGRARHDNAILVTRYDICLYKDAPCGTLGLAPVSGMCESLRSCSINEDIGLSSAFTIAHEIGHNFGMQHDGVGNRCGTVGHEPARIMAAQLTDNTEPFTWSSCSRQYITDFLDSGRGDCLDNLPPHAVDVALPDRRPGEMHDPDRQCRFQHGKLSRMCKPAELCVVLSCINRKDECVSTNIPAAEGSRCARDDGQPGWCYRGQCERLSYVPEPVVGGWGPWSEWGPCSRSCGGGVAASSRTCNMPEPRHGGKYCIGERKRYRSCNIQDCHPEASDFRTVQCESFNNYTFRGRLYKWKPFPASGQLHPCTLNCLAVDFNFYTEMSQQVTDGTRCYSDSLDICINGKCHHVGCDRILGSSAVEDKCRVCGGNGDTCRTETGHIRQPVMADDETYKEVLEIPIGAVNIKIEETDRSQNYLALKSKATQEYFINGAWTIDWPRQFEVANTIFNYIRPKGGIEKFTSLGPTSEVLVVMVLLQEKEFSINFEYNFPVNNISRHNAIEYVWHFSAWSECTQSCAKGISQARAVCVRRDTRKIVGDERCSSQLKPVDRVRPCNNQPCPPRWHVGGWTSCPVSCGGGSRKRTVICRRKVGPQRTELVSREHCPPAKPATSDVCNQQTCPGRWLADRWSECYPACADGYKTRHVYCVDPQDVVLEPDACRREPRPPTRAKCDELSPCPPPHWSTGAWGECSAECGIGQQRRHVACRSHRGAPSDKCDPSMKPYNSQPCEGPCHFDPSQECLDDNKVAYCPLVLKFRFCHRAYFYQMCCKTCKEHGFSVNPYFREPY